jgi:hypothetical protein
VKGWVGNEFGELCTEGMPTPSRRGGRVVKIQVIFECDAISRYKTVCSTSQKYAAFACKRVSYLQDAAEAYCILHSK